MTHLLMISIDSDFARPDSETVSRHMRYADALAKQTDDGHITVIAKTRPSANTPSVIEISPRLTVIPTNSRNNLAFIRDTIRLAAREVRHPVDLVTSQDPFASGAAAYWIARKRRVPYLLQNFSTFFDNPAWLNENPLRNRALNIAARFFRAQADFYRVSNRREYDSYVRSGGDPSRCAIQPVSTLTDAFLTPHVPDPAVRNTLGLANDAPLILWVGHPVNFKRVPLLFRVFQRVLNELPDARLVLIGDMTRSTENLAALAGSMGIAASIRLHGVVPNPELPPYYATANVYALTSSYEGVPRVLLEAAAVGLPIVALDAPGVDPIVHHGVNGCLIPENGKHIETMAAKLVELLRDPDRARQMGAAGREIARSQFNAENSTAALIALWLRAIALGRRDGRNDGQNDGQDDDRNDSRNQVNPSPPASRPHSESIT